MCSPEIGTVNVDVEVARNVSSRNPSVRFNGCKFGHRASLVTTKCSGTGDDAWGVGGCEGDDGSDRLEFATARAWHASAAMDGLAASDTSC